MRNPETPRGRHPYGSEPFYPHHVTRQLILAVLTVAVLVLLASLVPPPPYPAADPFTTPERVKPEWYFLSAYQFLQAAETLSPLGEWAPRILGVLVQGLGALALWFLPYWDTNPERHPARRPTAMRAGIALVFAFLILTVWGYLS